MRQIINRTEPASFITWKKKNGNEVWAKFSGTPIYNELREYLRTTQGNMCCYCEIAIKENVDAHIEHLNCKDYFPKERFKFDNLYASCQHNNSCGHAKGNTSSSGMILPNSNCESRFTYTDNGLIIPAIEGDQEAIDTIEILNLNNKKLKNSRMDIIRNLEELNDPAIIDSYLKNCVDWVNGFFTVVNYVKMKEV